MSAATTALLLNSVTSAVLLTVAAWLLRRVEVFLPTTGSPDEFALGSLVGALAIGLAVIALLLAGLAAGCWLVRRRLLRTSRGGPGAIVFLTLASLPALVIATFLVFRFLR